MSLVRKNWAMGRDINSFKDGYPPALRYLFNRMRTSTSATFSTVVLNKVENDWSTVLDQKPEEHWTNDKAERRFILCTFIKPGGWIKMCKNDDISTNSLEVNVTDTELTVRAVTDTGLVAEVVTTPPAKYLPNCRDRWFGLSIQVGRRGGNIELNVDGDGIREHATAGLLVHKGTINPYACTVTGHDAHGVTICPYYLAYHTPWYAYTLVSTNHPEVEGEERLRSSLYPKFPHKGEELERICEENKLYELFWGEDNEQGNRYNYKWKYLGREHNMWVVASYRYFGQEFKWKAPEDVRHVRATFISHGGWGSPAIPGITPISDKKGEHGAEGRGYVTSVAEKSCTLVIPPVCGERPKPSHTSVDDPWNAPFGGTHFADLYTSPPGCEYQPEFSPTWLPYIAERGQPTVNGEELMKIKIHFPGRLDKSGIANNHNMQTWYAIHNSMLNNKNARITLKSAAMDPYWSWERKLLLFQTAGFGVKGRRGERRPFTYDNKVYTETFPPGAPGKGAIWMEYIF